MVLSALAFGTMSLFADWAKSFDTTVILTCVAGAIIVLATPADDTSTLVQVQSILVFRLVRLFLPWMSASSRSSNRLASQSPPLSLQCPPSAPC